MFIYKYSNYFFPYLLKTVSNDIDIVVINIEPNKTEETNRISMSYLKKYKKSYVNLNFFKYNCYLFRLNNNITTI